ncbi:hypothetical protein NM688_g4603 [Phlebia brevispora]|uniref:Uncharacterized protein n=1 Tax=Phlebia brevispora TaxID=194682 RepID=A0ACC1T2M5_9APHY|nr:hypothetical protein NM688_g4603 [Phlebia brevispora]
MTPHYQKPSSEDNYGRATFSEQLQVAGAEAFQGFESHIFNLDDQVQSFAGAVRQLGSSVGILSSSVPLRERLFDILRLTRLNAAELFPRRVRKEDGPSVMQRKIRLHRRQKASTHDPLQIPKQDIDEYPKQLETFAEDVDVFRDRLSEFSEFTDDEIHASLVALGGDLKYWACRVKAYKGRSIVSISTRRVCLLMFSRLDQLRTPAVRTYLHDITVELGEHLKSIVDELDDFVNFGIPRIYKAQKHAANNLLILSSVATFFSAVTATTMQSSVSRTGTPLADSVNGFWFTSLIFSIAAAVNSVLAVAWKQAEYRSPSNRVPWWVLIWIQNSPIIFLVFSVACFSVGLVLFAYASDQNRIVSTVATVFTAFTSLGLAAVSSWCIAEYWIWASYKGEKLLTDVLSKAHTEVPAFFWLTLIWSVRGPPNVICKYVGWIFRRFTNALRELLTAWTNLWRTSPPIDLESSHEIEDEKLVVHIQTTQSPSHRNLAPVSPTESSDTTRHKMRLKNIVRSIIALNRGAGISSALSGQHRYRTNYSIPRQVIVPELEMKTVELVVSHIDLVSNISFSPNGKFLVTASRDGSAAGKSSRVFRLRVLEGVVGQLVWSTDESRLLLKTSDGVLIWRSSSASSDLAIAREDPVHCVAWIPHEQTFVSVESSSIVKLNMAGEELHKYELDELDIRHVAIMEDASRMVCVGILKASTGGLCPAKSPVEKQLLVYNLQSRDIESRLPILHDVSGLALARAHPEEQQSVLRPPQLWKIRVIRSENNAVARLFLRHAFMPNAQTRVTGLSHFGGEHDEFVMSIGTDGNAHIWGRESAVLLYLVPHRNAPLSCIAWDRSSPMFATGNYDGAMRLWVDKGEIATDDAQSSRFPEDPLMVIRVTSNKHLSESSGASSTGVISPISKA